MKKITDLASYLPNEEYHARQTLSSTKLASFLDSPLAYKHRFLDGNGSGPTAAMEFGSLVHCLALEPEQFAREYVVWTGQSRATKAGKEEWALVEADGRHPVKEADYEAAQSIAERIRPNLPEGATEAAYFARLDGVECQCKADRISEAGEVWDIKTKANLRKWIKSMTSGDLLVKDCFYRMVIEASTGILPPPVRYIAVSTAEPHDVAVRYYPEHLYGLVKARLVRDLERFKACMESGEWPGVDVEIKPIECKLDTWAEQRLEAESLGDANQTLDDIFGSAMVDLD